jgi:mannose-6-phosphate isomerase-like protein (cupin superfamily)
MKIITKAQSQEFKNGASCAVYEYPMDDRTINGAVVKLSGRYPDKGSSVNSTCKLMAYIIEGSGAIFVDGKETRVDKGDLVLVEPNEKYYWQGSMELFMPCAPAWTPEQYKVVE